ncbi:hypothetical protein [Ochrobactrum soli]|uniref:Uncharacterized protein n=1 Tax=Ochrobactrum soli TaxID=2448455 RepID=A0A849KKW1_9HYPH|nr:hypothetical protein [[Ochrobactrum] soli]NNU62445.1 hypothetical protein [[Ochrobactrum] soli]
MATPTKFHGSNMKLLPPAGSENVEPLHTFTNGCCSVSCWELSPEEQAEIIRTGRVFLSVFSGRSQAPVFVGSEDTVRSVVVDFGGVWAREKGGNQ